MNVLILGTILKDVYLNLDPRKEHFETDKHGSQWLNLGFNASQHYFFYRKSCLGGAAVTLEVLSKMGIDAKIMGSDLQLTQDGLSSESTNIYRYILISNHGVSYLAPSSRPISTFIPPQTPYDYIFIDRSANLDDTTIDNLVSYLESTPRTILALYLPFAHKPELDFLVKIADIVFIETDSSKPNKIKPNNNSQHFIYLNEHSISTNGLTEPLSPNRIDVFTHLSTYSIISATILGSMILNLPLETGLKMCRANAENSKLDTTLSLPKLKELASNRTTQKNLELIAANLLIRPKGILAADESGGSIKKKFAKLGIPDTYESRRSYRDILITAPSLDEYVSGVILFDETARQKTSTGESFVDYLINHRIIPGIKVDQGLQKYPNSDETYTTGLSGLDQRLSEYYKIGLRFAKWRAAFEIQLNRQNHIITPTDRAVMDNCRILAQYAKKCQNHGIVPIVEPEVVFDGYYSIEQSATTTAKVLDCLFTELSTLRVNLKACILKTNMIIAGKHYPAQSTPEEVGRATANILKSHVPQELAGIVFLSGGQTVEQSTDNLAAIVKNGPFPWPITFSFARALQDPSLYAWNGDNSNAESAKRALIERLIANTSVL